MQSYTDQIPFDASDFAENPEPRCPCLLLLDTSGSMRGKPIAELNAGLLAFKDAIQSDSLASKRVEVGIITFGPPQIICPFQTADGFVPPTLKAAHDTPMGAAIELGLDMIRQRKDAYQKGGIAYYRPWIMMITDGGPTDAWSAAAKRVREGEAARAFSFFAVAVEGADIAKLTDIAVRQPLRLKEMRFRDLFVWLSNSMASVSRSNPGDHVPLDNPATPDGWASV